MTVDRDTVLKVAHLARLQIEEEEIDQIAGDMQRILGFIDKLNELDTSSVEPLVFIGAEVDAMRNDEVKQPISKEEALQNAPKRDSDFFRVPKVIVKPNE